jgi:hypothetical protein
MAESSCWQHLVAYGQGLSEAQQKRISHAVDKLKRALSAQANAREFFGPDGEYVNVSARNAGKDAQTIEARRWDNQIRALERDIVDCVKSIVNERAHAFWSLGEVEPFRKRVETDARDILQRALACTDRRDVQLLNLASLTEAVEGMVSNWDLKAQLEFPPPLPPPANAKPLESVSRHPGAASATSASAAQPATDAAPAPVASGPRGTHLTELASMPMSGSRPVTVVRNAGTPTETRREVLMTGDFDKKVRFSPDNSVIPGDEIHDERFDEPRIVARVNPIGADGRLFLEAEIMLRSEWNHLDGNAQLRRFSEFNPPVLGAFLPRKEYPKDLYHKTRPPVIARNADEEKSARDHGYVDVYVPREYPKYKHHWTKEAVVVESADEEAALGGGWADSATAFAPYQTPRPPKTEQQNPAKWVDQWPILGLTSDHRRLIKAQLLRADAAFWRSPDTPSAEMSAMRQAFDGVAKVLSEGGILTESVLRNDLSQLIWDSAIAGGWYRFASEEHEDIFPEQVGHYWVWRDEDSDWKALFHPETQSWLAWLLENPPATQEASETAATVSSPDGYVQSIAAELALQGSAVRAPGVAVPQVGKAGTEQTETDRALPTIQQVAVTPKQRGRPVKIASAVKEAALAIKNAGGSYRDAARKLYNTSGPTSQQVKNAATILREHRRKSAGAGQRPPTPTE